MEPFTCLECGIMLSEFSTGRPISFTELNFKSPPTRLRRCQPRINPLQQMILYDFHDNPQIE